MILTSSKVSLGYIARLCEQNKNNNDKKLQHRGEEDLDHSGRGDKKPLVSGCDVVVATKSERQVK